MPKIFIVGYGKMGRRIHELCQAQSLEVSGFTKDHTTPLIDYPGFMESDVIIEFTRPDSALSNLRVALSHQKAIVSGTTGWEDDLPTFRKEVLDQDGRFFYASNFSKGMHITFGVNRLLAQWMKELPEYAPSIHEVHHTQKLDKPSGTAKTLAEGILPSYPNLKTWSLKEENANQLIISCDREPDVKGIHEVTYKGPIDEIMIRHEAYSRDGFAQGAIDASQWLLKQESGCYGMNDMLPLHMS